MNNPQFLRAIEKSFVAFLNSGSSRSTAKLIPLHGAIAEDIDCRLGRDYTIISKGFGENREEQIHGRYLDKWVDITIKKGNEPVGGISVKFVMQNYSQNSVNYFENMLGETANIRTKRLPYFQLFIIPDKVPYYEKGGKVKDWEEINEHNLEKYCALDMDDADLYLHSPDKMLMYIVHLPELTGEVANRNEYARKYKAMTSRFPDGGFMTTKDGIASFNNNLILNDYETFADKVYHKIMSL